MRHETVMLLGAAVYLASTLSAGAVAITPTGIDVVTPSGSANQPGQPYTDDLFLDAMIFDDVTFATSDSFRPLQDFQVIDGRENINAEWGDNDTSADGDANPFEKAGLDSALQETTQPDIQDQILLQSFASRSLTEMTDGESGTFAYRALFSASLRDNEAGLDGVPELIFFERGMNDLFDVALILGGDLANPVLSAALRISSRDFWDTGIDVDTMEIGGGQSLGVGAYDIDAWGVEEGAAVYGLELTRVSGGPDMAGFFLTAEDPERFSDPLQPPRFAPTAVPLPPSLLLFAASLLGMSWFVARRPLQTGQRC